MASQALKRQRDSSPIPPSSPLGRTPTRRNSETSLPPSSPLAPFSDTEEGFDERDAVADVEGEDEDAEGEDLFETLEESVLMCSTFVARLTDDFLRDYAPNEQLDTYSEADIDDGEFDEMSAAARRAAEIQMARRDRLDHAGRRGRRAALRSHAPEFLGSADDMDEDFDDDLGLSSMKKRTRKQYDERRDIDDLEGVENVS